MKPCQIKHYPEWLWKLYLWKIEIVDSLQLLGLRLVLWWQRWRKLLRQHFCRHQWGKVETLAWQRFELTRRIIAWNECSRCSMKMYVGIEVTEEEVYSASDSQSFLAEAAAKAISTLKAAQ